MIRSCNIHNVLDKFFIVAHRGASGVFPENTMTAFRKAVEFGADVVELDVRVSRDNIPIVFHDESLNRLTGKTGFVREYTFDELRRFDVRGERIPKLSEALKYLVDHVCVFIEIKEDAALPHVLDIIVENDYFDKVAVTSFNKSHLEYIRRSVSSLVTGLIYIKPTDGIVAAKKIGAKMVLPFYRLATEKSIAFAHRLGLKVVAWVINDFSTAIEYLERGVDGIATDYPEQIVGVKR